MINSFNFAVIPGSGGIYYDFGGETGAKGWRIPG